jgi:hypothetical protein
MKLFFEDLWDRMNDAPGATWGWFNSLNREEWLVVLVVVCACGFASLLGLNSRRI